MFCGSSSRCRRLVCSVWLWYCLIILTYFLSYPDARVFVLQICVSCAFSMCYTQVRFKVRWKRESTRINARQDHEYSYEMVSVIALTNKIADLEISILKCVDSVIGKSCLKFEICYSLPKLTLDWLIFAKIFVIFVRFRGVLRHWSRFYREYEDNVNSLMQMVW